MNVTKESREGVSGERLLEEIQLNLMSEGKIEVLYLKDSRAKSLVKFKGPKYMKNLV